MGAVNRHWLLGLFALSCASAPFPDISSLPSRIEWKPLYGDRWETTLPRYVVGAAYRTSVEFESRADGKKGASWGFRASALGLVSPGREGTVEWAFGERSGEVFSGAHSIRMDERRLDKAFAARHVDAEVIPRPADARTIEASVPWQVSGPWTREADSVRLVGDQTAECVWLGVDCTTPVGPCFPVFEATVDWTARAIRSEAADAPSLLETEGREIRRLVVTPVSGEILRDEARRWERILFDGEYTTTREYWYRERVFE